MPPPTLDLSSRRHNSKMVVSPPRINLRRAASYNNHDRGPLSSTSSRFNFNHLLFSPPPSPGLPALVKRTRKPSGNFANLVRPSRVMRFLVWAIFASSIYFFVRLVVAGGPHGVVPLPGWSAASAGSAASSSAHHTRSSAYEMAAGDDLPDIATPVVVTDKRGVARWTVSIPPSHDFPLSSSQYSDMCAKCREVAARVQALRSSSSRSGLPQTILALGGGGSSHPSESQDGKSFVDVDEAERGGLLGGWTVSLGNLGKKRQDGHLVGENQGTPPQVERPVCQRSMTFVLDADDAGLGQAMLLLWTAYGIAEAEGRAFFIDDSRWAYDDYAAIFQPPPAPPCRPPPRNQMIPCPRRARHLVVTSATAGEILLGDDLLGGEATTTISETAPDAATQKRIFALARKGHDALFRLNREDGEYVESQSRRLLARRIVPGTKGRQNGMAVGVHVRRGDRHPLEFQYRHSYVPTNVYTDAARGLLEARFGRSAGSGQGGGGEDEDAAAREHSFLVLASDDPTVYEADEFRYSPSSSPGSSGSGAPAAVVRAQERIKLASKAAIQRAQPPDKHVMHKFVDETFGWEGGFFAPMFKNLGVTSAAEKQPAGPDSESTRLRSLVGRAYVMDLAVLAEVSDAVVCTVSAAGCRLLAVMMGWEDAMEAGNWVNVDGRYRWTGVEL